MKKLEIGPRFEGWLGEDWDTLDVVSRPGLTYLADKDHPFDNIPDSTYDLIYLSHVLEHVHWYKVVSYLEELYRILKKGGVVEIWVPDFKKLIGVYFGNSKRDSWEGPYYLSNSDKVDFKKMPPWNDFQWVLGRMFAYQEGNFDENLHKGAFDKEHLSNCLNQAGFIAIKQLDKPRGYDHGWINLGMSANKG